MDNKDTGRGLSAAAKRELLELKLRVVNTSGLTHEVSGIPRRSIETPVVLSFAQQRLWTVEQLYPGNNAYIVIGIIRLHGLLNVAILERCLNELMDRHEILRTTFPLTDAQPYQHIAPPGPFILPIVDLTNLPMAQQEQELQRLLRLEAQQPFDLAVGPLFRVRLLRLTNIEHVLLVSMHHSISDTWSLSVLNHELAAFYSDLNTGQRSLPDLPIQYADFAVWQREWLQGAVFEAQLAYWKQQLAGAPNLLALPTDHSRPAVQTFHGATYTFDVPASLDQSIRTLSLQAGATLFMTLLAAFNVLLARYTGLEDLLVGSPIAGRTRAETESLIGFFVNTLVLRANLSGNPTFRELLNRVREVCLDAYVHQELPFERLVEELQPERDLSRNPLVQVFFALRNILAEPIKSSSLQFELEEGEMGAAPFDLFVEIIEIPPGLKVRLNYSTDLFEAGAIVRLAGHYQQLLEAIVADPEQCIWKLPLLTEGERQQLLMEWNATQTDYPKEACIHEMFEAQVERDPGAIAVIYEDKQLTYQELDQRANQLAHRLQQLGVKAEVPVGICADRSLEMVVGLLGILKAGGFYVPLDPTYPPERLAYMLEDTQAKVILAHERFLDRLPKLRPEVLLLDSNWQTIRHESVTPLSNTATPNTLAYVMYTSGSTGKPKGVSIEHHSVVRLVKNTNYINFSADEVFLQFAPITFDASTFEIWGPLLNGGQLVVFPAGPAGLQELGAALQHYHVTILWLTAGLFHQMVELHIDDLRPVRQLFAGGDVLSVSHVRRVLRELADCQLTNGYGPTENTTFTTCYSMTASNRIGATVPIGRPIANTQIYVLDQHMQLVPVSIPGELYIGGDGLARNYLNRPELTNEHFLPHPFSEEPGAKLYKTGDLVRYLPDGNLEFLGRRDQQVKIRGFRVELGEVEAVLNQHSSVRESLVLTGEDVSGNKRLVAYVVSFLSQETPVAARGKMSIQTELRTYLKERLPEYMVPMAFVFLDAWPLTENGKVDRHRLPLPSWDSLDASTSAVAPRTATEKVLVRIWKQVLGLDAIAIYDNFFDLGGHSLLTTRVISQIRKEFHLELPFRVVFELPTIVQLAERIESLLPEQHDINHFMIHPIGSQSAEHLLARLSELTDEEVEALLNNLNAEKDPTTENHDDTR